MNIIELKVTMEDVEPEVKRNLLVPLDINLDYLHDILQAALGWTNSHLYMFQAAHSTWGMSDPDWETEDLPAHETTLMELLEDTGVRTFDYLYDFGDGWEHRIRIGKISDPVSGHIYPQLTYAAGRCPPEDVGGALGYEYFLEVMTNKKHPEYEELLEWCGEPFNPNDADEQYLKNRVNCLAILPNKAKS